MIISIDWYEKCYRDHFLATSPSPTWTEIWAWPRAVCYWSGGQRSQVFRDGYKTEGSSFGPIMRLLVDCSVSIDFPLQIKESHRRNGELRVFDRNPNLFLNLINSFLNQNNAWWKKRLHRQTPLQKMHLNQTQTNTFFTYTVCAQFHSWHTMTCNLEENEALKQSKRKGWEQDEALTLDKQWRAAVCFSVSEYSTITPSSATQPIKALRTSSVAWRLLPWLR